MKIIACFLAILVFAGCSPSRKITGAFGIKFGQKPPADFKIGDATFGQMYVKTTDEFPPFNFISLSLTSDGKVMLIDAACKDVSRAPEVLSALTTKYGPSEIRPVPHGTGTAHVFSDGAAEIWLTDSDMLNVQYMDLPLLGVPTTAKIAKGL